MLNGDFSEVPHTSECDIMIQCYNNYKALSAAS